MKKTLLSIALSSILASGFSQIELRDVHGGGTGLINGTEITVNGLSSDFEVVADIEAKNISGSTKTYKVKKREIFYGVSGMDNAICWSTCSPPVAYGSQPVLDSDPLALDNDSSAIFNGHVYIKNLHGPTKIRFVWFDVNDLNDTAYVDVVFDVANAASIEELSSKIELNVFPNPANSGVLNVNLDEQTINSNAVITVTDLLGKVITTIPANNTNTIVNTENFKSGVYFVSVQTNTNAIKTKKVIITN